MKFDLVIGNPPYNNDIYLDFIKISNILSYNYTCMITPAKWQAKNDNKNNEFRSSLVPYISRAIVYKDTKDVFDIAEPGGLCICLIDKNIHQVKYIKTSCIRNKNFESDGFEVHNQDNLILYNHKILNIIYKILGNQANISDNLEFRRQVYVGESEYGDDNLSNNMDYVSIMQGEKFVGYKATKDLFTTIGLTKYKCIQSCMPVQGSNDPFRKEDGLTLGSNLIMILGPNQVPKGSFQILRYFDTYEEALSLKTYLNSMTMSLMQFLGLCGAIITKEFFRYIPDISDFNIIYEDKPLPGYEGIIDSDGVYLDTNGNKHCSLYIKYNLSQSEIGLIESIIRPRKTV